MFQRQINNQPAPGVAGAFASANTPATYVTGPGGLISAFAGIVVGVFGWAIPQADASEVVYNNAALVAAGLSRAPSGFIANEQQGLNLNYMTAEGSMTMLGGQAMELFTRGDFWAKTSTSAARDQKIFANLIDGTIAAAAALSVIPTFVGTASFATNVMTVTAVTSGTVKVGQAVTGANIPANTYVSSFGTGTGGTGTYNLTTAPGTIAAQATTSSDYVETRFRALSTAAANEIVKIGYGD